MREAKGNQRRLHMHSFDLVDWIIAERCHRRPTSVEETEALVGKKLTDECEANGK